MLMIRGVVSIIQLQPAASSPRHVLTHLGPLQCKILLMIMIIMMIITMMDMLDLFNITSINFPGKPLCLFWTLLCDTY